MKQQKQQGFTLIEMIGVLAIIAILVGAVAPRIFEAIQESKANNASTLHKTAVTAITKFYADVGYIGTTNNFQGATTMGTLINNITDGPAATNSFSGLLQFDKTSSTVTPDQSWAKFRGPYLEGFTITAPPIGTEMGIDLDDAETPNAAPAANNGNRFDLDFDGLSDIPDNAAIATLRYNDVSLDLFEKVDAIIDGGLGADPTISGKVKYGNGDLRIYIRHD